MSKSMVAWQDVEYFPNATKMREKPPKPKKLTKSRPLVAVVCINDISPL